MGHMFRWYDYRGTYSITQNSFKRKNILTLPNIRKSIREALIETNNRFPFVMEAFVLLPNHFHMLITIEDSFLSKRMSFFKRRATQISKLTFNHEQTFNHKMDRRGALWHPRYWEETIRSEEHFYNQLVYLYKNPVHHGYVTRIGDWPYSTFHNDVRKRIFPEEWKNVQVELKSKQLDNG